MRIIVFVVFLSIIKGEKNGPKVNAKRHWCIMVDERSTLCMTKFYKTKNGMVEPSLEQFRKWQQQNILGREKIVNFLMS